MKNVVHIELIEACATELLNHLSEQPSIAAGQQKFE